MRHYRRPEEPEPETKPLVVMDWAEFESAADAGLSPGSATLAKAVVETAAVVRFPSGLGLEYGSLLKTSVRPDLIGGHIDEAVSHLREREVDLLFVPGMSGYPIGAAYAIAAEIPAVLLKKTKLSDAGDFPAGAFTIPSYTGSEDVLISADSAAVRQILTSIIERKRIASPGPLTIRIAGADDIVDKGTMAAAIGENAIDLVEEFGRESGVPIRAEMVAFVTPLMKGYNRPAALLDQKFGFSPFAGVTLSGLCEDPSAIEITGVGWVGLPARRF